MCDVRSDLICRISDQILEVHNGESADGVVYDCLSFHMQRRRKNRGMFSHVSHAVDDGLLLLLLAIIKSNDTS